MKKIIFTAGLVIATGSLPITAMGAAAAAQPPVKEAAKRGAKKAEKKLNLSRQKSGRVQPAVPPGAIGHLPEPIARRNKLVQKQPGDSKPIEKAQGHMRGAGRAGDAASAGQVSAGPVLQFNAPELKKGPAN